MLGGCTGQGRSWGEGRDTQERARAHTHTHTHTQRAQTAILWANYFVIFGVQGFVDLADVVGHEIKLHNGSPSDLLFVLVLSE